MLTSQTINRVLVEPSDHRSIETADNITLVEPCYDFAVWSIDGFHNCMIRRTTDAHSERYVNSGLGGDLPPLFFSGM
jgi:hypothetical protein